MFDGAVAACCCDRMLVCSGCAWHVDYPMNDQLYRIGIIKPENVEYMVESGELIPVKPMKRFSKYDIYLREPPDMMDAASKGGSNDR